MRRGRAHAAPQRARRGRRHTSGFSGAPDPSDPGSRASRLVQLPPELLHRVLSGLPGADRRALAATCFCLRRFVVVATRAITVPSHDYNAVQCLVSALHLWPQLREVRIRASPHASWSERRMQGWAGRGGTVAVQLAACLAT
jgi:hypothetical protein